MQAAVRSVVEQDYLDVEYCIKDGGSSDRTVERAAAAARNRAQVRSQPDRGLADAVNQGFECVAGDLQGWLNGDDMLLPGTLRYVAAFFARNPGVDVVYGHRIVIDEEGNEIGRWLLPRHDDAVLSYADYVPQETLFWRRSAWQRAGGRLDDSFSFAVDWDLLLRFRATGARMVRLPRFLGAFRVHAGQKTWREMTTTGAAEQARLRERALGSAPSRLRIAAGTAGYLLRHVALRHLARAAD